MVVLFLVDGFEEVEAVTPLDYLRRAGVDVQTVGVNGKTVTGSHGIKMEADLLPEQVDITQINMLVLPGGPGTGDLENSELVQRAVDHCVQHGLPVGAICAAPSILGHKGLLQGKKAVCFPGYEQELVGAQVLYNPVCTDGNVITSRGAGTAQQFALALVEKLCGKQEADKLSGVVQWQQ